MLLDKKLKNMASKSLLLKILLIAIVLNKSTDGKAALQPSWMPFRPLLGYFNQQSFPPFWNPFNPLFYSTKFQSKLTTSLPQLQAPPHFHQNKNVFGVKNSSQNKSPSDIISSSTNLELSITNNATDSSVNPSNKTFEGSNTKTLPIIAGIEIVVNDKATEPGLIQDASLFTPNPIEENDVFGDLLRYFKKQIRHNKTLLENNKKSCGENCEVTSFSPEDQVFAESNLDLQVAEANNYRRRQRPTSFADDFYDYLARQRRPENLNRDRYTSNNNVRVNSKRGQYRTTTSSYYEDYDFTTPRTRQRKTTPRRNNYRRRTTPAYEIDEYEDHRPIRRKGGYDNRRGTTPSYDDYYEDEYDYTNNRPQIRPRQEDTTDAESTSTTTTTESTTSTTTESTASPTVPTPTPSYPYPGSNANSNISITYGPPHNHHPGYGPSHGNEHVSITYGPPTGPNFGPILDNWYNQYTKSSVLKRIQELLTPNNYYSPQYEMEKYNYDGAF